MFETHSAVGAPDHSVFDASGQSGVDASSHSVFDGSHDVSLSHSTAAETDAAVHHPVDPHAGF
ncbi:hypothetical protein [Mycobacterium kyorinense]|uniref:hypothetical protein n=1 Tax=Mycobacterium kyorinense TaxID=487514 RepID=UPI000693C825|nr:hypothetical protein [Mycobacterium kyorinense]